MQELVPSNAKGQKAYHGHLATQSQGTAIATDNGNTSDGDPDDGDGDGEDDEGGNNKGKSKATEDVAEAVIVGVTCANSRTDHSGNIAGQSGGDEGLGMDNVTGGSGDANELEDRSPLPLPSVTSKHPFSAIKTQVESDSITLPPPSVTNQSTLSASHTTSSSSSSKHGQMTGAIALTHIGTISQILMQHIGMVLIRSMNNIRLELQRGILVGRSVDWLLNKLRNWRCILIMKSLLLFLKSLRSKIVQGPILR